MKYKLDSIDIKQTQAGKDYAVVTSGEQKGSMFEGFTGLKVGDEVEGDFTTNGKYTNFRLKTTLQRPAFMGNKTAQMEKVMERKEVAIEHAQERKQDAIAKAGAFRDATLVSLASLRDQPFPTDEEYKEEWVKWVKFFLNQGEQPFI